MLTFSATASPVAAVSHMFDVNQPSIGGIEEKAPDVPMIRQAYLPRYASGGAAAEARNPIAPTNAAPAQ